MRSTRHIPGIGAAMGLALAAGGLWAFGIAASDAGATVIQSSNFNTGLVDSGGTAWTTTTGAGATVTDSGTDSTFTNDSPGKSMQLTDTATTTPAAAGAESPFFTNKGPLQVSFDFEDLQAVATENYTFFVQDTSGARDIIFNFWTARSGTTSHISTNAGTDTSSTVNLDQWYHVVINLPASNATTPGWGYTVTDTTGANISSASGIAFRTTPGTNLYDDGQFTFNTTASNSGQFNIDNVVVSTIPEPAALSLVVLGGLGLLMLRPRRRA